MNPLLAVSVLVLIVKCDATYDTKQADNTLELVHIIFRHGDRTPDQHVIYKNDPHINETYYPFGFGQLTNAGKRKEYQIGKALRRRYLNFLGDFTLDSVDSRCTDYNRTKMSLQLVLASLFPPTGKHVWQKNLNWQPVPFNYWPDAEDHVLGDPHKNCPVFQKQYLSYLNSTDGRAVYENYTSFIKHLEEKTGQRLYSKSFAELYFTLTTETEFGFEIPAWAKEAYPRIKELAEIDYETSTETSLQKKLASGFLMKKILQDSHLKAEGKAFKNTRIFLYSAHESNIAHMLRFLGIFERHIPPYGSYIAMEVHNISGSRIIKIYYQDYSTSRMRKYRVPKCGKFCTLKKFEQLYKHLLPVSEMDCFEPA